MSDEDTFKIILSTDNHLGFNEKDPIRGNDSFITFEEILSISKQKQPDFILLGGDLFHENKPSIPSLFKCSELIRKYSYNSSPINFQIISDQSENFSHSQQFKHANFNDANLNIGLPIFSIHGNHDDPIDQSNLCALDLFHASGLVNLFGKSNSVESIHIRPILMQKSNTKLAIYGLGAIRNERLHRLFEQRKVTFYRPEQELDNDNNNSNNPWFSIFVIHQNRVKHSAKNYIPETFIPSFIDLVIWGHEHDCRIDPEYNTTQQFHVCQPGSSVATSLSEGESIDKYIALLSVKGNEFKIDKIKLQTVRPFLFDKIILEEEESIALTSPNLCKQVEKLCHDKMEELLEKARNYRAEQLPIIRLAVDYSGGFEMFSAMRFSQEYIGKVANPKDLLMLHRKREQLAAIGNRGGYDGNEVILSVRSVRNDSGLDRNCVEDLISQLFQKTNEKLALLNEKRLANAVKRSIDKDDKEILMGLVDREISEMVGHLTVNKVKESFIGEEIRRKVESTVRAMVDNWDKEGEGASQPQQMAGKKPVETIAKPGKKKTTRKKNETLESSIFSIDPDQSAANSDSVDSNFTDFSEGSRKRKVEPMTCEDDKRDKKKLKTNNNRSKKTKL